MSKQSTEKESSRSKGWTKYVDEIYDPIKVGSIDGKSDNWAQLFCDSNQI